MYFLNLTFWLNQLKYDYKIISDGTSSMVKLFISLFLFVNQLIKTKDIKAEKKHIKKFLAILNYQLLFKLKFSIKFQIKLSLIQK